MVCKIDTVLAIMSLVANKGDRFESDMLTNTQIINYNSISSIKSIRV